MTWLARGGAYCVGRNGEAEAATLHGVDARAVDICGVPDARVVEGENRGEHKDEDTVAVLKSMTVMVGACRGGGCAQRLE